MVKTSYFYLFYFFLLCVGFVFPVHADISDDFTRADDAAIGNGWIEKSPTAFTLLGGEASKQAVGTGYLDNLVFRPSNEDVLDVETSVEFTLSATSPGYIEIWSRVQSDTVLVSNWLEGYILFINDNNTEARIGRSNGNAYSLLATVGLSQPLNTTDRFRLRLSTEGTSPVVVTGYVERFNGADWDVLGQATVNDNDPLQIVTPGTVGFSGHVESGYVYDNFVRTNLGGPAPVPATSALSPASISAGSASFTLTVTGNNFVSGAAVRWNGVDRITTYVSSTQLQANILASDISAPGSAAVTVFNPAPGGGVSNAQTFTMDVPVDNPVPVTVSLTPVSTDEGGSAFTLTINGSDFVAGSVIRWNGSDRTTAYVSATQLQASITAADIATAGNATVTVFNPLPGGGLSNGQTFTVDPVVVNNPVPVASGLTPGSTTAGGAGFTLIVNGSDFVSGAVVRWNGADRTTTYVSASQLQAAITAVDIASTGIASVTVFNPLPGGGVSSAQSLSILEAGSLFTEAFSRADGAAIGNGWIEKSPAAFTLLGGEASKQSVGSGYLDNLVFRPSNEDILDVETSVEFTLSATSPGYIEIWSRVQSDTVLVSNWLEGYILFINDNNTEARIGRSNGNAYSLLATVGLSQPLNTTDRFRLRLSTEGTSPVVVTGYVERFNGADWDVLGQATVNDNDPLQIVTPGTVGFSGHVESGYVYDNFVRTNLGGPAPVPATSALSPASISAGSASFTLTVTGNNFVSGAAVRWNGVDRITTYVSSTQLQANILASDISAPGSAAVTVFNPAPGGGVSNAQTFTMDVPVDNPVPVTVSLTPVSTDEGGSAFTLTINGSDFVAGSVIRWNGSDRTTAYVSATQLQASITAADIATAGNATVTVFNPLPGGGLSNGQTFTVDPVVVNNPVPVASGLTPGSTTAGGAGFTLIVNGSDFVSGAVVRWNGADRTTTYVSASQLQAAITAVDIASTGIASVTVFNPLPGGGVSSAQSFNINQNGPLSFSLNSISPNSSVAGAGGVVISVFGNNFPVDAVVRWNGADRVTNYISPVELQVDILATDVDTAGLAGVTVSSLSEGTSTPQTFFILESASTGFFFDNFNRVDNEAIGNMWTEKLPATYSLINNQVVGVDTFDFVNSYRYVYRDNIVYRPDSEDYKNVELSVEFVKQQSGAYEFNQLHGRIQRDTVQYSNVLQSYLLYVEDTLPAPGGLAIAINRPVYDEGECIMRIIDFPSALVTGERYRMRFRIEGDYPVVLTAYLDRFDGQTWQVFTQGSAVHDVNTQPTFYCDPVTMPPPISKAGAVGFSKWFTTTQVYDNFYWKELEQVVASNPTPEISYVSPAWSLSGVTSANVKVSGNNFVPGSIIRWNGTDLATTFVSETTLETTLTATELASSGSASITVYTPAPGGGESSVDTFEVFNLGGTTFDDFNRADGAIGNGWVSNNGAFGVISNEAAKIPGLSWVYQFNITYRPDAESTQNMESQLEFRLLDTSIGYPQVYARIQSATTGGGNIDGYLLYLADDSRKAVIARQLGDTYLSQLATMTLSEALNTTDRYRMRLSSIGTDPVVLTAYIERFNGSGWDMIGSTFYKDSSANRITTPGVGGFSGSLEENSYTFDNFTAFELLP